MDRIQRLFNTVGGGAVPPGDTPQVDTAEQIYISSLTLLKMLKHGGEGQGGSGLWGISCWPSPLPSLPLPLSPPFLLRPTPKQRLLWAVSFSFTSGTCTAGRAGVPMEVMGLLLGEFVDDYTVRVVDVFAMPQSGTGVSVEAVDPVFQTKMVEMLKQVGR